MQELQKVLDKIEPIKEEYYQKAQERLDSLTKPPGSLGRLEEFARRYVAIREDLSPKIKKKVIFTFAGDHGVVKEGVSAFPQEVTTQMVYNFSKGGAGINVIARHIGAQVIVVDIGVAYDFEEMEGLVIKKVGYGTKNMAVGPAMTREEAIKAIMVGVELAEGCVSQQIDIIGTGDMGIGNTTPSSAIVAAITGLPVKDVTGRGTGLDDKGLQRKIEIIEKVLKVNKPNPEDPLDVLAKVGGFEIAGITGLMIGAAANRIPAVVDGFISTAGALIACELNSLIKDYIFASHKSVEIGHRAMLERIGREPMLDLSLRLGEGTGAALGIDLIEVGVKILTEMATFAEAGISGAF